MPNQIDNRGCVPLLPQHAMRNNPAVKEFQTKVKGWDQKNGDRSVKVCHCSAAGGWELHAREALRCNIV